MGYNVGSKNAANGLVFGFNANSERSYVGPPIQNMATTIAASGSFSDTNIAYAAGTETVNVPTLGTMTVPYMDGYNANSGSYCCLQPFYFVVGNGYVACSGSTQYTYSIVYRTTSGYTHPNYMYRYEHTSGGSYVTEVGIHDDAKRVHLGDGWYWAWNTFTTQATTARLYLRSFYYQYNISDRHSIARVLVTPGDYTGLPPRLWPAVNTTRTNTQAIVDLSTNGSVTANNLAYASNGNITFNGSSSYLSIPNNSALQVGSMFTVNAWVRPTSLSARSGIFSTRTANDTGSWQLEVGPANGGTNRVAVTGVGTWILESGDNTIANNTWVNICYVRGPVASESGTLYINGSPITPITTTSYSIVNNSNAKVVGSGTNLGQFFTGSIDSVSLYNRMLTADEVRSNFNAQRGKYGL